MEAIEGKRILISGATGQVAYPVARALAARNEVIALARFARPGDRDRFSPHGIACAAGDLSTGDLQAVPSDVDYVLHFAVAKSRAGDFDADLEANAGGAGRLLSHCRGARAFLHCSSTAVYEPSGHELLVETSPLGDNHRAMLPTYSLCKIAAEAVVRFAAREWGVPVTIARLNVPYGDNGGWPALHLEWMLKGSPIPVHPDAPSLFNPIHEDDILRSLPGLLGAARVPATIVNWGGSETVSLEEWCGFLGELTGIAPRFAPTERTIASVAVDTRRLEELAGPSRVAWRDGLRRMVAARHPEIALHA